MIKEANQEGKKAAVYAIRLQHLDQVNNSKKIQVFETIIQTIASRILNVFPNATLGRVGSKEYALSFILEENENIVEKLTQLAIRVIEQIEKPITIDDYDYFIYTTIGFTVQNNKEETAEQLYHNAIISRNKAILKKQPFLMYNDKLQQEIDTQLFLENELEKSIDRKELEVHYQPKLSWQPEN
jgi:GGDEF domain-containing protein